jgi:transcription initiation factor TFIID subunit 2
MQSLCHAMLGKVESRDVDIDDFDMERMLETQAEEQLEKDAIAEFDRYRRMDEWSSSFQNVYSRAALRCQMQLMRAKILDVDIMQFLPYTRAGTYDLLRADAFECLVELDIFKSPELVKWFMFTMSSDSSLWLRRRLHDLFGKALAPVAFGREPENEPSANVDNLIIEQESSTKVRQADLARKQTVTGAIEALKGEISGDQNFKECLWASCNSPGIGILELSVFADLCKILYDSVTSVMVKLKYPRYWQVKHLGKVIPFRSCILFLDTNSLRAACISHGPAESELPSHPQKIPPQVGSANAKRTGCLHLGPVSHSSNRSWVQAPHQQLLIQLRNPFRSCIFQTSPLHRHLSHRRRRLLRRRRQHQVVAAAGSS